MKTSIMLVTAATIAFGGGAALAQTTTPSGTTTATPATGPSRVRHHEVFGRVVTFGVQQLQHLVEVLRAQALVVGRERGRRGLDWAHGFETPWLRHSAA